MNARSLVDEIESSEQIILHLKQTICSPSANPPVLLNLCVFQRLLEHVGTPDSIESTLGLLQCFKAHSLLFYFRDFLAHLFTLSELESHIHSFIRDHLVLGSSDAAPEEEKKSATNILLFQNDSFLASRATALLSFLSSSNVHLFYDSYNQLISEFPLKSFQRNLCCFLDQIQNSLHRSSQEAPQSNVTHSDFFSSPIKATDLALLIDYDELQTIHKVDNEDLRNFLRTNQIEHFFAPKLPQELPQSPECIPMIDKSKFMSIGPITPRKDPPLILAPASSPYNVNMKKMMGIDMNVQRPHESTIQSNSSLKANSLSEVWTGTSGLSPLWIATDQHSLHRLLRQPILAQGSAPLLQENPGINQPRNQLQTIELEATIPFSFSLPEPDPKNLFPIKSIEKRAIGKTPTGQRKRKRWTDQEVSYLMEGVRLYGIGSWKAILTHFDFGDRSYVDLKDKFRNLRKHYSEQELLQLH